MEPGVGDRIRVAPGHRMAHMRGQVISTTDHPGTFSHFYHVRFDGEAPGAAYSTEFGQHLWLCIEDLIVTERAPRDQLPGV